MTDLVILIAAVLVMLPGLLGVIIPVLPGVPYMWLVAVIYAFATNFAFITGREIGILALIAAVTLVVDYSAGLLGARFGGASRRSTLYGFVGLLLGLVILPPLGSFIGLFVGTVIGELTQLKTKEEALRAGSASLLGAAVGVAINLALAIAFIVTFIVLAR